MARAFLRPQTPYGAGHRGVDLVGAAGAEVLATDAGAVTHVGVLAGRGTVTIRHASGLRSTYEPVTGAVRTGDIVTRGQVIGRLSDAQSHCAPATCLHLGALLGEEYLDPLVLLGTARVRLLPLAQAPDG